MTINKSAKFETLQPFCFLFCTVKGFSSKHIALKVDSYRIGKCAVCRCVLASFSLEILQAGAVKELKVDIQTYKR